MSKGLSALRAVRPVIVVCGSRGPTYYYSSNVSTRLIAACKIGVASNLPETSSRSQTIGVRGTVVTPTRDLRPHHPLQPLIFPLSRSYIREFAWVRSTYFVADFRAPGHRYSTRLWPSGTPDRSTGQQTPATSASSAVEHFSRPRTGTLATSTRSPAPPDAEDRLRLDEDLRCE